MKNISKYKVPLAAGGLLILAGTAALNKSSETSPLDSTESRKHLSDFELADAQSGAAHRLTENEFADRKAQEAFSGSEAPAPKPRAEEAPLKQEEQGVSPSEASARTRAAELLGPPAKEAAPAKPTPDGNAILTLSKVIESSSPPNEKPTRPSREPSRSERPEGVSLASAPRAEPSSARPLPMPMHASSGVYAKNPPSVMARLDDEEVTETMGSRSTYVRGDLLKMGSVYLAKIPDAIDVRGNRKQKLNIPVIGKMTEHTVNQPFVLVGEASLAEDGRSIFIEIKDCTAPNANARSIPCSGDVKSLDGTDGLRNEIYSPSIWPSILSILGTAGEVYSLGRMTQSVTSLGVLMDQSQSNALWGAAGAAWKKSFDLSAERLERERDGGRASGGAIVKVMITKDTPLW